MNYGILGSKFHIYSWNRYLPQGAGNTTTMSWAHKEVFIYIYVYVYHQNLCIFMYTISIQGITEKNAVWYVIRRCIPIAWVETVSKLYSKVGKWIPKVSWRSWEPTGSNKTAGRHTNEIHKTKNTKIQKSKNIYVKELLYMVKYLYLYFVF